MEGWRVGGLEGWRLEDWRLGRIYGEGYGLKFSFSDEVGLFGEPNWKLGKVEVLREERLQGLDLIVFGY